MRSYALSDDDVRDIAGRASTIDERLAGSVVVPATVDAAEHERIGRLLSDWRQVAAAGDDVWFARRLRQDGLDERTALDLLGPAHLPADRPLPDWARVFRRVTADWSNESRPKLPPPQGENEAPQPFEELLWPVVLAARTLLAKRIGDELERLLAVSAVSCFERGLLTRLSTLCGPGLFGDFSLFRHLIRHQRGLFSLPFSPPESRVIYEAYLSAWRAGRCRDFFLSHPVAARLIGVAVSQWVDNTGDLAARLAQDLPAISDRFWSGAELGQVETIRTELSDPHRGGRTVAILTFARGLTLVYKPKDLGMDAACMALMNWLNDRGAPVELRPVQVLPRDGYGWAEFVRAEKNAHEGDRALFYRRAGGLLAFLHLLRGADFHQENIISAGGFPVPIDFEALLHPDVPKPTGGEIDDAAEELATALLKASVLRTLYLPTWVVGLGGRVDAVGGLDEAGEYSMTWTRFVRVNTDAMAFAPLGSADGSETTLDGMTQVAAHLPEFMAGFNDLYTFLVRHRAALLEPGGPLTPFRGMIGRVILKDTPAYSLTQRRACSYANLASGADWSVYLDRMLRWNVPNDLSPEVWALCAAERTALTNCDIPMFTARTDQTWLEGGPGERIESALEVSPFDQLLSHVQRLGDDDRLLQERLITSASASPPREPEESRSVGIVASDFTATAVRLGQMLDAASIRKEGAVAWFGPTMIDHEHRQVWILGLDLYAGTTGVALFMAALARMTGEARFRALALAAVASARARLTSDSRIHAARSLGIGGGAGIGSVIYGFSRIAGLLDEPSLVDDARSIADLITSELIEADRKLDVIKGAAGAILGLLSFYSISGDDAALARAIGCGRHLLESRRVDRNGNLGWPTRPGRTRHLTGFSHGAAGIALALLRLYRATGDTEFRAAADDALAYERKVFMPNVNRWPDFEYGRMTDGAHGACQWCHGETGIGLARVGCLNLKDDHLFETEIEVALSATLAAARSSFDHLCCGDFGRIDFLLTAGMRLSRPELVTCARERASALIEEAEMRGRFSLGGGGDRMNPGFFQGISGIGYELLRMTAPETLPSVLLWD